MSEPFVVPAHAGLYLATLFAATSSARSPRTRGVVSKRVTLPEYFER